MDKARRRRSVGADNRAAFLALKREFRTSEGVVCPVFFEQLDGGSVVRRVGGVVDVQCLLMFVRAS